MQLYICVYAFLLTWTIQVVRVVMKNDPRYMGCYSDDESNRAMSIQTTHPTDSSVEKCVGFCRDNLYTFAGLENGTDCHCGEEFHKHGQSDDGCNVTCSGDNDVICGGKTSLSIYSVCPPGVYGRDCKLSCPVSCVSKHKVCQIITGQCCQGDLDQSAEEVNCNYFNKIDCGELSGDPRPEVKDMSTRAGYWFNLFTTLTFNVNAKVTGVKYFSRANNGTVYLSFWRNIEVNASEWLMVAKLKLQPKMEGIQEKKLKPSESVYVRTGDAVGLHYPYGSGIIPYENQPSKRSDLEGARFYDTINTPLRGEDWTPGHVISFTGAAIWKRLAAIKIQYDCIEECPDSYYGNDCGLTCGHCLGDTHCHYTDGSCPAGCQPGYRDVKCDQACAANTYGYKCQRSCSTNCEANVCDQVSGACIKGCKPGYTGAICDEGGRHSAVILISIIIPVMIIAAVAVIFIYIFWWKPCRKRKRTGLPKSTGGCVFNQEATMMREDTGANNTAFEDPLLWNEQKPAFTSVGI